MENKFEWEEDLHDSGTKQENIDKLHRLVSDKIKKGQNLRTLGVVLAIVGIASIIIFIGIVNILQWKTESRYKLVNGSMAFFLAIVSFYSPYAPFKPVSITSKEVNTIIDKPEVTGPIMEKIRDSVEKKLRDSKDTLRVLVLLGLLFQ